MPRLVLPFGAGLDRYTGVQRVRPGTLEDLVNVRPLGVKLQVRRGMVQRSELPSRNGAPCTAVLLVHGMQSQPEGIAVGYHATTREVYVYRVTGGGTDPISVGHWFTLDVNAPSPPVITAAESYGRVFFAHNEAATEHRAATQVYDSIFSSMSDLEADLDGRGTAPVRFRGVQRWRNYLTGWGWASPSENRPEMLRVSLPGEPLLFDPEDYFQVGDRGSAITNVKPAGSSLLAFKNNSTYRVSGTSHLDFGILPVYALFGCLSARLAITVEGTCYVWSFEGPWATTGADAQDLEPVIDLERLAPEHLPSAGVARTGFAAYVPGERIVEFHFGERIYALSLEAGGATWSYRTRGRLISSGGLMYPESEDVVDLGREPPTGYPRITGVTVNMRAATVSFENTNHTGNEAVETWLRKEPRGEWERIDPDQRVAAGASQDVTLSDLEIGARYGVALRYRLSGVYGTRYRDPDPGDWPAVSRFESFQVGFAGTDDTAPTLDSVEWLRTSGTQEAAVVRFTPTNNDYSHKVTRVFGQTVTLEPGITEYRDFTIQGERSYSYLVQATVAGLNSGVSNSLSVFTGPPVPRSVHVVTSSSLLDTLLWTYPEFSSADPNFAGLGAEISVDGVITSVEPGRTQFNFLPGSTVRIRSLATQFGTADRSMWEDAP